MSHKLKGRKQSKEHIEKRMSQLRFKIPSYDRLHKLYVIEQKTLNEIGKLYNTDRSLAARWLKNRGIKARSTSEAASLRKMSKESNKKRSLAMKGKPHTKEHNDKVRESKLGIKSHFYKDGRAWYVSRHKWVRREKGKAPECVDCGKQGGYGARGQWLIQWSNIDHEYSENLDDYVGRCSSCHKKYDIQLSESMLQ